MTKRNIVKAIVAELGLPRDQTKQFVQKILNAIVNTLVEEGRVELRNFGVFGVRRRQPRKARNPRTGEQVMVGERCVVTFKAGRVMEDRINQEVQNHDSR
jgi:nucleoid DNA-binding protein